jgi:hypothetical protein
VLLWFEIDDFEAALARAAGMNAEVVLQRHRNPPAGDGAPNHWECWLRDPDDTKASILRGAHKSRVKN